ncbi:MAG: DUF4199 domain-containing protein [Tenacibaculum sp.]
MKNEISIKNLILNYGLILGTLSILLHLIQYALGQHIDPHWSSNLLSVVLVVLFIIYGIKKYKQQNNYTLTWGQSLKVGVGIAVFSAFIYSVYFIVFTSYIEPNFYEQLIELQSEKMIDKGLTDEQIEMTMKMTKKFVSPYLSVAFGIISFAVLGFITSAITGAVLKTPKTLD